MISIHHRYSNLESFENEMNKIDVNKESLIQIFTSTLIPEDAVFLAKEIKHLLPLAKIIGSSVNAIIHCGKQYEEGTLIVVEQYDEATIETQLIAIDNNDYHQLTDALVDYWTGYQPSLLRMFIGNYYDYAHQFMDEINKRMPSLKIAGGISGELCQSSVLPYVFNDKTYLASGIVCAGIMGCELKIYNKINTSHETISPVYTITKVKNRVIKEIEHQDAKNWLQKNIGFLSTKQYDSWEDIAQNDPLVRFQLALEGRNNASRFVRYDENSHEITQYFSRLAQGDQFRLSYTSPSKCVEECRQTSLEIIETPIEHLFVYSCLFRKLYMNNCAQWELTPYHKNCVSGVFLLGEFGHNEDGNLLLNGSCVLSGIAEKDHYLDVDMSMLIHLESLKTETEGLMDFIIKKQNDLEHKMQPSLLMGMKDKELVYQLSMYTDLKLNMPNLLQYEKDRVTKTFNKLCMLKIQNAESLISYIGQDAYYKILNEFILFCNHNLAHSIKYSLLGVYSINYNTLIFCDDDRMDEDEFKELMLHIEGVYDEFIKLNHYLRFVIRLIVVFDDSNLLEQAYIQMEESIDSQLNFIVNTQDLKGRTDKELKMVDIIQKAISNHQVIPYYQGIYNNNEDIIDKYEALIRIKDDDGVILSPEVFMDIAKKYRLYIDLNAMMIKQVIEDFKQIDCEVNINLSVYDLQSPSLKEMLFEVLQNFYKPSNITIELLEDECFLHMEDLNQFIKQVRSLGVKIAIDDFGSGYSNLLEIAKIRPDYIKIDGGIVRYLDTQFENEVIIEVIASLGEKLSIELVAEFVENEAIQEKIKQYHIGYSQGYLFSKPIPFEEVLKKNK